MNTSLLYGKKGLDIELPDRTKVIEPKHIPGLGEKEKEEAFQAMKKPTGQKPLKECVNANETVAIVISDSTRPTPNHKLIPWILEELNHVPNEQFVIINGTGSHRDNTYAELCEMLGKEVVDSVRVINNQAFDPSTQAYLGTSSTGAEIYLNKEYVEADRKIVTGFIEPHFFAGFSGGPKGIMPGIAGIDTIMHFHSAKMIAHPMSTWRILKDNPVQGEATEITCMAKPDFMLNVALNKEKEITAFFAGDVVEAHREGCKYVKEHAMAPCEERFDIVITSNSGYPLDQNLYQAVKGMSAAQKIVKEGGAILCAAECSDGLPDHGNYADILKECSTPQDLIDMINDPNYSKFDQWQVQKQAMIQVWSDVYVYSTLQAADLEAAMLSPIRNMEETIQNIIKEKGGQASIAIMPQGPLTIPYIENE
ncbi:nickel-dependent lactate racemase [Alteribacillus sp. JSM 102045]|uniref:nickel-dependent lactate racemase n=1 Tax=Alteribacillus sp. JSM 102045 TaxID=1562101 RepID=UPI0035C0CF20